MPGAVYRCAQGRPDGPGRRDEARAGGRAVSAGPGAEAAEAVAPAGPGRHPPGRPAPDGPRVPVAPGPGVGGAPAAELRLLQERGAGGPAHPGDQPA